MDPQGRMRHGIIAVPLYAATDASQLTIAHSDSKPPGRKLQRARQAPQIGGSVGQGRAGERLPAAVVGLGHAAKMGWLSWGLSPRPERK